MYPMILYKKQIFKLCQQLSVYGQMMKWMILPD